MDDTNDIIRKALCLANVGKNYEKNLVVGEIMECKDTSIFHKIHGVLVSIRAKNQIGEYKFDIVRNMLSIYYAPPHPSWQYTVLSLDINELTDKL